MSPVPLPAGRPDTRYPIPGARSACARLPQATAPEAGRHDKNGDFCSILGECYVYLSEGNRSSFSWEVVIDGSWADPFDGRSSWSSARLLRSARLQVRGLRVRPVVGRDIHGSRLAGCARPIVTPGSNSCGPSTANTAVGAWVLRCMEG